MRWATTQPVGSPPEPDEILEVPYAGETFRLNLTEALADALLNDSPSAAANSQDTAGRLIRAMRRDGIRYINAEWDTPWPRLLEMPNGDLVPTVYAWEDVEFFCSQLSNERSLTLNAGVLGLNVVKFTGIAPLDNITDQSVLNYICGQRHLPLPGRSTPVRLHPLDVSASPQLAEQARLIRAPGTAAKRRFARALKDANVWDIKIVFAKHVRRSPDDRQLIDQLPADMIDVRRDRGRPPGDGVSRVYVQVTLDVYEFGWHGGDTVRDALATALEYAAELRLPDRLTPTRPNISHTATPITTAS